MCVCKCVGLRGSVPGPSSYFIVDVSRTLRWHFLYDVDRMSVIAADLLVVRAVGGVRSPQRDDDVTGLCAASDVTPCDDSCISCHAGPAPSGREGRERQARALRF